MRHVVATHGLDPRLRSNTSDGQHFLADHRGRSDVPRVVVSTVRQPLQRPFGRRTNRPQAHLGRQGCSNEKLVLPVNVFEPLSGLKVSKMLFDFCT